MNIHFRKLYFLLKFLTKKKTGQIKRQTNSKFENLFVFNLNFNSLRI